MAFSTRTVVVPTVVLAGVIAAAAFYLLQPHAVSTRSDTQLERIKQTCEDKLTGLADEVPARNRQALVLDVGGNLVDGRNPGHDAGRRS